MRGLLLEYDKLARMVQRQQNVAEPVPPFYIRTLISLEVALNTALAKEKEAKKEDERQQCPCTDCYETKGAKDGQGVRERNQAIQ